ncbi:MAG: hypothetical protein AAF533_29160 [Acidobacteriota bacterium]
MAERLGEHLVSTGAARQEDIDRALRSQALFGARLGTNLLELGLIEADVLFKALSEVHGVPAATLEELAKPDADSMTSISKDLCDRHGLLALSAGDTELVVAMIDPADATVIDEIALLTGLEVSARVAPELLLRRALARHLKVPLPERFVRGPRPVDEEAPPTIEMPRVGDGASAAAGSPEVELPTVARPDGHVAMVAAEPTATDLKIGGAAAPDQSGEMDAISAAEAEARGDDEGAAYSTDPMLAIRGLLGVEGDEPVTPEMLTRVEDLPDDKRLSLEKALADLRQIRRQQAQAADAAAGSALRSLSDVAHRLADVASRDAVGELIVRFAGQQLSRVSSFVVSRGSAMGWHLQRPGEDARVARDQVRRARLKLSESSVLKDVIDSGSYYLGELPRRPGDEAFAAVLGNPRPKEVVVMPIPLQGRTVAILTGDELELPLDQIDLRALRSACRKAGMAIEVLVKRASIRKVEALPGPA